MTVLQPIPTELNPAAAAPLLANLGFLSSSDLPDRPGPAYLLVALRDVPTFHHFDPEAVDYWVSSGGRGERRLLTRETILPVQADFSWGLIRVTDRLHVTNEFLTFGGRLEAADIDGVVIGVFTSPAPLLRRGGHSQGWDDGAESLGAFFGRFLLAVDYAPGFEAIAASANPITRYAAFIGDTIARYRASSHLRARHADLWCLVDGEERRLRASHPAEWSEGEALSRVVAPRLSPM